MPQVLMDVVTSEQVRYTIDKEMKARENWYKQNNCWVWATNVGPIKGRIMAIIQDKQELARKIMESQDELTKKVY